MTKITRLFNDFFESNKSAGLFLILTTVFSLLLANIFIGEDYVHFWHHKVLGMSISHWINDGLMAIFFLLIGLELRREILEGELSNFKDAALPAFGAVGGMLIPALMYIVLTKGTEYSVGFGIPMATDIAFAIGVLSLLGNRVPASLKVFLTALAVIDDLGAIIVIAIFYTETLLWGYLFGVIGIFILLRILNRLKVLKIWIYLLGGVAMWYFMLQSGIHATIAGVLLAFTFPVREKGECSPACRLEHLLEKPVAFFIIPIFAMASTAIIINPDFNSLISESYSLGISLGLILGKPIGVIFFAFLATILGFATLPDGLKWRSLLGVGLLAGIGFTMSIFITLLAFKDSVLIDNVKLIIILSSLIASIFGFLMLYFSLPKEIKE